MQSCLSSADLAIWSGSFPESATPAGTPVVRSTDLLVHRLAAARVKWRFDRSVAGLNERPAICCRTAAKGC